MDKSALFKRSLDKQKEKLLESIENAKEARDNAPGAMESASDTRRSQAERLIVALEEQLKRLDKYAQGVDSSLLALREIKINSVLKKFLLVPEGLGGEEVEGIRLLSVDTPLGHALKGRGVGDKIDFNGQSLEILKIE
jgi:transcription elongation GreA/GreB family factor